MSSRFFETDPALKDAFEALKDGCKARDPERIQTGMCAYLGHVKRVAEALQPEHHATFLGPQDLSDVWDLLHELTPLGAGLAEDTLVPGMQAWVTNALNVFCQALVEHTPTCDLEWYDEASEEHWALDWTNGSPAASLRLYFARWEIYPSLPSRMGYIIPAVCLYHCDTVMDSPLRTLQRTLLFVAAVCRFATVDEQWHERVRLAAGHSILDDLDETADNVDDFLKMLSGKEEWYEIGMDPLKDSLSGEMVLAMLMARRAGKRLKPPLAGQQLDALTYAAGESYIGELYRVKWRLVGRCWRARAAAIKWHRQVRAKLKAERRKRVRVAVLVRLFALRLHRRVEETRRTEREADWADACAYNPVVGGQPGRYHALYDMGWEAGRVRGLKRLRSTTTDA